jgi:two-component system, NarL family, response regulator NreC
MNGSALTVLLAGGSPGEAELLEETLNGGGSTVHRLVHEQSLEAALGRLSEELFDVVLLDQTPDEPEALEAAARILAVQPTMPIVVLADARDEGLASAAVLAGAQDCIWRDEVADGRVVRAIRLAIARSSRESDRGRGEVRKASVWRGAQAHATPATPRRPVRILLVDDHPAIRRGLIEYLNVRSEYRVVGEASSGEEAIHRARELRPDVIAMDLIMPGMGGLEAIRRINQEMPKIRIVALTADSEEDALVPALEAGASGFVDKTAAHLDLPNALRTVMRGDVFIYPTGQRLLLGAYRKARKEDGSDLVQRLSDQDRELLRLIAEGFTSREIGKALFLAPSTVDTYRSQLMKSLGLAHRTEVVRLALRSGLLSAERTHCAVS